MKFVRLLAAALLALQISLAALADGSAVGYARRIPARHRPAARGAEARARRAAAGRGPQEIPPVVLSRMRPSACRAIYCCRTPTRFKGRAARGHRAARHRRQQGQRRDREHRRSRPRAPDSSASPSTAVFTASAPRRARARRNTTQAIARAFKTGEGHPFYYDTAWDVMRLIDYLATRKDVDAARIGLTGISKGGIETYLTAAADHAHRRRRALHRRAEFQVGAGQRPVARAHRDHSGRASMRRRATAGKSARSVDFVREFYARVVPGIDGQFDGPAMLALIAPRPLLVINGGFRCQHAHRRCAACRSRPRSRSTTPRMPRDKLQLIIAGEHAASREPREHRCRHRLVRALAEALS